MSDDEWKRAVLTALDAAGPSSREQERTLVEHARHSRWDQALLAHLGNPAPGTVRHELFRLMIAYRDTGSRSDPKFEALSPLQIENVVSAGVPDDPVVREIARLRKGYLAEENLLGFARLTGSAPQRLGPWSPDQRTFLPIEQHALRGAIDAMHDAPEFAAHRDRHWRPDAKERTEAAAAGCDLERAPGRTGRRLEDLAREWTASAPHRAKDPDREPDR
jgi:hypothetical protein